MKIRLESVSVVVYLFYDETTPILQELRIIFAD